MQIVEKQPVLENFRLIGLHGYKDVEINFDGPARIVIAENGMGKTTILTALRAFLGGDLHKLRAIQFRSLECKLANCDRPLLTVEAIVSKGKSQ